MNSLRNLIFLTFFLYVFHAFSQHSSHKLPGILLDQEKLIPLPYATIFIPKKNTGVITNEKGHFYIDVTELEKTDTIIFQYLGYHSKKITVDELRENPTIYLMENIISLNEFFVFASGEHNAQKIVEKVLENKEKNYKKTYRKKLVFARHRFINDFLDLDIKFKKSSFAHLDERMTNLFKSKVPKQALSFSDFLGDFYFSGNENEALKINPKKVVKLKDKSWSDLGKIEEYFEKMVKETKEGEYWKVKSGIIGSKIDLDDQEKQDSLEKAEKGMFQNHYYSLRMNRIMNHAFKSERIWDFLYKPRNYNFSLFGGTKLNGEDVFIIDFTPKSRGKTEGRLFITMETYALVKADFKFAQGKNGKHIQLFGIGYTEDVMDISIFFEKIEGNYELKYYAQKTGNRVSFDRNLSLIKKKKRFLLDKKLNEIKVKLDIKTKEESNFEILVMKNNPINNQKFTNFKQPKLFKIKYVNQFNDDIWKGYDIIAPTERMKNYKKLDN